MIAKKIVIVGGPGSGKTSIINELKKRKYLCCDEISRQITIEAQKKGIDQLFLTNPIEFSDKVLKGRIKQFEKAEELDTNLVFLDRGIPDVIAYLDYSDKDYPDYFETAAKNHKYDFVFILAPWQDIFESDNERYENFAQAKIIHHYLHETYKRYNYKLIDVPFDSVKARTNYIINTITSTLLAFSPN